MMDRGSMGMNGDGMGSTGGSRAPRGEMDDLSAVNMVTLIGMSPPPLALHDATHQGSIIAMI